ncbi:hypothetical protein [Ruegeria atlantica]|uniref:hypothetical protein n=1 Tax=Ruegeria atlantica TaxID=81569 RepID=UPI00147FF8A4|nr:hypothetical protein [Ruegeria atlantica]
MRRDADDNYLGPLPEAFVERPVDDYLSVTWCEYFQGNEEAQLRCAIEALRNSNMNVKAKACFCVGATPDIIATIEAHGAVARAVYYPVDDNPAHAGIYGVTPEEVLLQAVLADEVWNTFLTKQDVDAIDLGDCQKSNTVG